MAIICDRCGARGPERYVFSLRRPGHYQEVVLGEVDLCAPCRDATAADLLRALPPSDPDREPADADAEPVVP